MIYYRETKQDTPSLQTIVGRLRHRRRRQNNVGPSHGNCFTEMNTLFKYPVNMHFRIAIATLALKGDK